MTETMNFDSVITGMVLGDSWLTFNRANSNISFYHTVAQEEYLRWKASILKRFKIEGSIIFSPKTESNYPKYKYWSLTDRRLTEARSWLYQFRDTPDKRRKFICKKSLNKLDDLGLAIWFMDDGYNDSSKHYMHLGTYCFTEIENKLIANWLLDKYSIETKIYRRKDKYFLVWYKDAPKLASIIKPYVEQVSCMHYKIEQYR